jgi:sarcosine oxidase subunit alpha
VTGSRPASHRLPAGGLVDRLRPVRFTFDGVGYSGFDGDTLASALVANGVRLVGRSFKYHRPRGLLSAGVEEPKAHAASRIRARPSPNSTTVSRQAARTAGRRFAST